VPPHYTVSKVVGCGAYGLVVSALDGKTGTKIAIKKCTTVFKDVGDCKRILREIKLQKFLKHENLLGIVAVYVGGDRAKFQDVYIVSELLDTDVNTVIRSKQKMSEEHVKYFVYQLLRGLKYLHSAQIMHRDLKPANLLVNVNCDLKICDYGLARGFDNTDALLTDYVVTRWYRPPELLMMNKTYSPAVDIWSVGCILAELFNRKPLFMGKDYLTQLKLVCQALGRPEESELGFVKNQEAVKYVGKMPASVAKPWSELVPDLSPEGQEFIKLMLRFDPETRPSAAELMAHSFMASLHDADDEPASDNIFAWELDRVDLDADALRELLWEETLAYDLA
jgi:mitogen-activated protein kinase 1/3